MTSEHIASALNQLTDPPQTVNEVAEIAMRDETKIHSAFTVLAGMASREAVEAIEGITARYTEFLPHAVDAVAPLMSASEGEAKTAVLDFLSTVLYRTYGPKIKPEAKSARAKALNLMGAEGSEAVVEMLKTSLARNAYYGNEDVIATLGRIGTPSAIAALEQAQAQKGSEERMSRDKLAILTRLGSSEALAAIARQAYQVPYPQGHAHALAQFGEAGFAHLAGMARSPISAISGTAYAHLSMVGTDEARALAAEIKLEFAVKLTELEERAAIILKRIDAAEAKGMARDKAQEEYADECSQMAEAVYYRAPGNPVQAMTILAELDKAGYCASSLIRTVYTQFPAHADVGRGILQGIHTHMALHAMMKDVNTYEETVKVATAVMGMSVTPDYTFDGFMRKFPEVPDTILYTFDRTGPHAFRGALLMSRYSQKWEVEANAVLKTSPTVQNIDAALEQANSLGKRDAFIVTMGEIGTTAAMDAVMEIATSCASMQTARLGIRVLAATGLKDAPRDIARVANAAGCEVDGVRALVEMRRGKRGDLSLEITKVALPMIQKMTRPSELDKYLREANDDQRGVLESCFKAVAASNILPREKRVDLMALYHDAVQIVSLGQGMKARHKDIFGKPAAEIK